MDPYSRSPDRLNEVETIMLAAGFAITTMDGTAGARMVPARLGSPILISENGSSQCLCVVVQNNLYQNFFGFFAGASDKLIQGFAPLEFTTASTTRTVRQILLPKEQLWAFLTPSPPPLAEPTHFIVMEVTP